ncbi:hypothetical protein M4578_18260 [Salipiger sp. P9]|nr:hypothetical protein [Salipiger pentaromativorans]
MSELVAALEMVRTFVSDEFGLIACNGAVVPSLAFAAELFPAKIVLANPEPCEQDLGFNAVSQKTFPDLQNVRGIKVIHERNDAFSEGIVQEIASHNGNIKRLRVSEFSNILSNIIKSPGYVGSFASTLKP